MHKTVDVYVGVLPWHQWLALNRSSVDSSTLTHYAQSVGFVRVDPRTTLRALRQELQYQLNAAALPGLYVFVRIISNHATWPSAQQETLLQVKEFVTPRPEIILLETDPEANNNGLPLGTARRAGANNAAALLKNEVRMAPADDELLYENAELPTRRRQFYRSSSDESLVVADRPPRKSAARQQNFLPTNSSGFVQRPDNYRAVWEDVCGELRQQVQALELKEDELRRKIANADRQYDEERRLVRDEWQKRFTQSRKTCAAYEAQLKALAQQRQHIVAKVANQVAGFRRVVENPAMDVEDLREQYSSLLS